MFSADKENEDQEFEWQAAPGYIFLTDGSRVFVQPGDTLIGSEMPGDRVAFKRIIKRVIH